MEIGNCSLQAKQKSEQDTGHHESQIAWKCESQFIIAIFATISSN